MPDLDHPDPIGGRFPDKRRFAEFLLYAWQIGRY